MDFTAVYLMVGAAVIGAFIVMTNDADTGSDGSMRFGTVDLILYALIWPLFAGAMIAMIRKRISRKMSEKMGE